MSFFNARIPKRRQEKRREEKKKTHTHTKKKAICTPFSSLFLRGSLKSKA
jgi:hypothetical protein